MVAYLEAVDEARFPDDQPFRKAVREHVEFGARVAQQNSQAKIDAATMCSMDRRAVMAGKRRAEIGNGERLGAVVTLLIVAAVLGVAACGGSSPAGRSTPPTTSAPSDSLAYRIDSQFTGQRGCLEKHGVPPFRGPSDQREAIRARVRRATLQRHRAGDECALQT